MGCTNEGDHPTENLGNSSGKENLMFPSGRPRDQQEKQCTGQLQVRRPWCVCFGRHGTGQDRWDTWPEVPYIMLLYIFTMTTP